MGIHEICGHYKNLETGLRKAGNLADFISLEIDNIHYGANKNKSLLVYYWRYFSKCRSITPRKEFFKKSYFVAISTLFNSLMVIKTILKYDVLLFAYGITFTNTAIELFLYKTFGKRLIFMFHGSDSRPPYISIKNKSGDINYSDLCRQTEQMKKNINRIEKYADLTINWGPTAHFHEKKFINCSSLGYPINLEPIFINPTKNKEIKILHCPSDTGFKGSDVILEALDNIANRGIKFKLTLLTNVPNEKIIEAIKETDFVIDSLYSDISLGTWGIEAASFGKPTVLAGYLHDTVGKYFSSTKSISPACYVHPNNIEEGIEKMITNHKYRNEMAKNAYNYMNEQHGSLSNVVNNYLRLFNNDIPDEWWFDPNNIDYIYGDIPELKLKEIILSLIEKHGLKSLQLKDKPLLEKMFEDYALLK